MRHAILGVLSVTAPNVLHAANTFLEFLKIRAVSVQMDTLKRETISVRSVLSLVQLAPQKSHVYHAKQVPHGS